LPSEKKAPRPARRVANDTFSGPLCAKDSCNAVNSNDFPKNSELVSLHFRLRGGEQDIRTLGTIFIGTRADVSVSYTESVISENPQRLPANRAVVLTSPV
jgi:hypothetical protein